MILYRWQGRSSNFGDELNTILWPKLLPDFFDDDPSIRFLGIGSVLDQRHSSQAIKLVAGTGYGGYEAKPRLDDNWIIHWVRGPRTAAMLGLPASLAVGDPGVLVPPALGLTAAGGRDVGFMPHFESAAWGAWKQATDRAGMRLIDPRDPPLAILQAIGECRVLLSEAMHGVIVADALRVPWIAVRPRAKVHRAKWSDWAESLQVRPRFQTLAASTLSEWAHTSRLTCFHAGRNWLAKHEGWLKDVASERWLARAVESLGLAARAAPQLSAATALDRCQSRMMDRVAAIRIQPLRDGCTASALSESQTCLQPNGESAYQLMPLG